MASFLAMTIGDFVRDRPRKDAQKDNKLYKERYHKTKTAMNIKPIAVIFYDIFNSEIELPNSEIKLIVLPVLPAIL
jgi:hypothetical protein